jgi:hypothetical protein
LMDRGDRAGALQQLGIALKFNPLSLPALNLRYAELAGEMSAPERISTLLAMLRSNPMQTEVLASVARELTEVGLGNEALPFFDGALRLTLALNTPADPALVRDLACRLIQANNAAAADTLMKQLLAFRPDDVAAHCIRLSIAQLAASAATQPSPELKDVDTAAQICVINELAAIAAANGDASATTRPADAAEAGPLPDLVKLAEKVAAAKDQTKSEALATALNDYGVYVAVFAGKPAGLTPVIAALKALGPDVAGSEVSVTRLEGWQFLLDGKPAEARVKLSAVSPRDPLSALGLIRVLAPTEPADAKALARKLRAENPSGPLGAMIFAKLKGLDSTPVLSPVGEQAKAELARFPMALLRFGEQPQTFYSVRVDPVKVAVDYASPLMARVTLTNLSQADLTIGQDGAIRPDIVVDMVAKGPRPGTFPRAAFDYINNAMILHPRQSVSRVIRVDQSKMASFLGQTPQFAIPLFGTLTTNPVQSDATRVAPGPGGVSVQFSSLFERQAAPAQLEPQRIKLMNDLATGSTDVRLASLEALFVYSQFAKTANDAKGGGIIDQALAPISKDPNVAVRAWSTYLTALRTPAAERKAAALLMTSDPEWVVRVLGLALVPALPLADRQTIIAPMLTDPDVTVAALARAQNDELLEGVPAPGGVPSGTTMPAGVK